MKIIIGADEAGYDYKEEIKKFLTTGGYEVIDCGVYDKSPSLYPDIAIKVCNDVLKQESNRGILICGTGIGMAITANKVPHIRAAVCHDIYSAQRSRKSNDAQILCMGARVIGIELAKVLVLEWLHCEFSGGGSTDKVERIKYYENLYHAENHQ
ncbi:MAG TPA: ribose 5-phosphate isomerase B [Firmicutes bacterium]|jgi:ribose 5-phosphate isomerase B|nr:ribose 5-phosphate isomerase B [Bacillota bacterium]